MPKPSKSIEAAKAHAWFVYILRCSDGSLYTGITTDVDRRSEQHNAGTAARYTRCRLPVRVEYQEPQASRSSALKREWAVKAIYGTAGEGIADKTGCTTKSVMPAGMNAELLRRPSGGGRPFKDSRLHRWAISLCHHSPAPISIIPLHSGQQPKNRQPGGFRRDPLRRFLR